MTVIELIRKLQTLPEEAIVWGARGFIEDEGPQTDVYIDDNGHAYIY